MSQQHLRDWVNWLFPQPWPNDAGSDGNGTLTENLNGNRDPWFLSGNWGAGQGLFNRTVRVPQGRSLFIVLASSHAAREETGMPNDNDQALENHALRVHTKWDHANLTIRDGNNQIVPVNVERGIETGAMTVNISPGSYYDGIIHRHGPVRLATVADVCLFNNPGNVNQTYTITMDAESPAAPEVNEPSMYKVNGTYRIRVVP